MKAKRRRRVEIVWRDSYNLAAGWHSRDAVMREIDNLPLVKTAGFVVGRSKRCLMIASTIEGGNISAVQVIPRSQVARVRRLR